MKKSDILWTMYDRINHLNIIARSQGLLSLEDALVKICEEETGETVSFSDPYPWRKLSGPVRLMIELGYLIVDGHDENSLAEIAANYNFAGYSDEERLAAKMTIVGMTSIQRGESPPYAKLKMLTVLPEYEENRLIDAELAQRAKEEAADTAASPNFLTSDELDVLLKSTEE